MDNSVQSVTLTHSDLVTGEYPAPCAIVAGLIDEGEVSLWSAIFGSGKSIAANHVAEAVAAGVPAFGKLATIQGSVLYLDAENAPGGVSTRLKALQRGHGIPNDAPVHFEFVAGLSLEDMEHLAWLDARLAEVQPTLLVLDSWVRFIGSTNENDAGAVARINGNIRALTKVHGCAVLTLDHVRKTLAGGIDSPEHRTRGSGEKGGFVANLLALEPTRTDGELLAQCAKRRYGPKLPPFVITRTFDPDAGALTLGWREAVDEKNGSTPGEILKAIADTKAVEGDDGSTSAEIALRLGCSEVTARRALFHLVSAGLVRTREAKTGRGRPRKVYDIIEQGAD